MPLNNELTFAHPTEGRSSSSKALAAATTALWLGGLLAFSSPSPALAAPDVTAAISVDVFSTDPGKFFAANDYLLISNIYESLYGHDEKGNLVPALATAVEMKDDGLTYEFTLRPNVKFHNGNPFTAEDVQFSWKRAADPVIKWARAGAPACWWRTSRMWKSSIRSRSG